jgi:hypothetical protein
MLSAEHQKTLQTNALFADFTMNELAQISQSTVFVRVNQY